MDISLITIYRSNNYGAILQAYATVRVLEKYGNVTIINYVNDHLCKDLNLFRFGLSIRGGLMLIHDVLRFRYRKSLLRKIRRFIGANFNETPPLSRDKLFSTGAGIFDVYVCGSDQIWNSKIVSRNKTVDSIYFLSFAVQGAKKIAYASSMGSGIFQDNDKALIRELLVGFHGISMRERDGIEKLSEVIPNREIKHALDPTLLLRRDEWLSLLNIQVRKPKKDYILVYTVPRSGLLKKAVDFFSEKLDLEVVLIDQMLVPGAKADRVVRDAGPDEFVEFFSNASFVITDSFHGVSFAIQFEKPFASIALDGLSNRVTDLLDLLDLKDRLVWNESQFDGVSCYLDYTDVYGKLDTLRAQSISFLDAHLIA